MDLSRLNYNDLRILNERGQLDVYDLMERYKDMRLNVMRQVRRIEKSDVPFFSGERPEFAKVSDINSTEDLLHAVADIQRFKTSGNYSIAERHARRAASIETMHSHGMDFVNEQNYGTWARFMRWFYDNKVDRIFGSRDDVVEEFFDDNWEELEDTPVSEWEELFEEYTGVEVPG